MVGLVVLGLGALCALNTKTVSPAHGQLQDGEISLFSRHDLIDRRDAGIGQGQGNRPVFEHQEDSQEHKDRSHEKSHAAPPALCRLGKQPIGAVSGHHHQCQHQHHAEPVGDAVGLDHRRIVQKDKGQRHIDQQAVQVKDGTAIDLQQRPQAEDAKDHETGDPGRKLSPVAHRAGNGQHKATPAEENRVHIAKARGALPGLA